LTKTSTQNNNNVNQFQEFIPGFTKQRELFGKTLMAPVKEYNGKTNKTSVIRRPYPYISSPIERFYNSFITKVVDPTTNQYNPPLDDNGYPIVMPDNGPNCRYIIKSIILIRLFDGSLKLYSMGQLVGFDGLGQKCTMGIYAPENYQDTKFGSTRRFDDKTGRIINITTTPIRQDTAYTMDYSPENLDKLYEKTWDGKNQFFKPNTRNVGKRVILICKDESSGIAKEIFWQSTERSLELMKTKSFEELFTDAYLPLAVREERARFSAGYMEEQQKTTPTPPSSSSSGPTTSNTSAYK
jgi:hypothetical protein